MGQIKRTVHEQEAAQGQHQREQQRHIGVEPALTRPEMLRCQAEVREPRQGVAGREQRKPQVKALTVQRCRHQGVYREAQAQTEHQALPELEGGLLGQQGIRLQQRRGHQHGQRRVLAHPQHQFVRLPRLQRQPRRVVVGGRGLVLEGEQLAQVGALHHPPLLNQKHLHLVQREEVDGEPPTGRRIGRRADLGAQPHRVGAHAQVGIGHLRHGEDASPCQRLIDGQAVGGIRELAPGGPQRHFTLAGGQAHRGLGDACLRQNSPGQQAQPPQQQRQHRQAPEGHDGQLTQG